jgi:hypothetical protein
MHAFFETACREGQLADVRFFLSKGHPVNALNAQGMTALMLAADMGHMDLSLLLLRHGADVDKKNKAHQTASMMAQSRGHLMLAKLLCGKRERRQKHPFNPNRMHTPISQPELVRLLDYGLNRGFLSDAQIYSHLPALRQQPTEFSMVCQALQSLGIALRDRTPEFSHGAQAPRCCAEPMAIDLNEYAKVLLGNLSSPAARGKRSSFTYLQPVAARAVYLRD